MPPVLTGAVIPLDGVGSLIAGNHLALASALPGSD
jgi:hypothetical protein